MKRVRKFWSHEGTPTQLFEVSLFVVISVPVGVRIFILRSFVANELWCSLQHNVLPIYMLPILLPYVVDQCICVYVSVTCRSERMSIECRRECQSSVGENVNRVSNCFDST